LNVNINEDKYAKVLYVSIIEILVNALRFEAGFDWKSGHMSDECLSSYVRGNREKFTKPLTIALIPPAS